uniref:C-C motif chemokine 20-like n=1 Tax=Pristiophorus japonicus TaxID=55135 RepID=UPI00398F087D
MSVLRKPVLGAMLTLVMLSMFSDSVSGQVTYGDCCLSYSRIALPFKLISGYVEQQSNEICDIDAIIFYTVKGRAVCANPESKWVKKVLKRLSKKLKKMSQ